MTIPLRPQSIQDLAWGLSLFFSSDEQERKFGADFKSKWDKLAERYKEDEKALNFLDNVNAVMAGTIYRLAQLRKQVNDQFQFLDLLKKQRIKNLEDLANLSKDAESIATRLAGISIGGGSLSILSSVSNIFGTTGFLTFLIGAGVSYFILELILKLYCKDRMPKVLEKIQEEKKEFLTNEFEPKSKEALEELLKKIKEIAEKVYEAEEVEEYTGLTPQIITNLSSNSASATSGSFLTGSTIPPDPYYGGFVGSSYYGGGAIDTRQAGRYLRGNYESETDKQ